jgi:hypothetical protein
MRDTQAFVDLLAAQPSVSRNGRELPPFPVARQVVACAPVPAATLLCADNKGQ